ncbi:MAG: transposase [Candidatus Pacebacteria bacterium]|nr:transposase [Candidatus Paceibacterota bacterium]
MPKRKEQFENGEIYHITIRRIGDNLLFKDINDYFRGIFSIYEFNNLNFVEIRRRREERKHWKEKYRGDPVSAIIEETDKREKMVEVLAFCLMPNHMHLLIKQTTNNGISKFMQKIGAGYSAYFREKYKLQNKGYFFQSRFKAVYIENDEQLKTVFVYIHTNPIALIEPGWKENGIKNLEKAIEFLESYKWSSYQDYLGKKNFPSVTERDFLLEIMGREKGCKDFIDNWAQYKSEVTNFNNLALE